MNKYRMTLAYDGTKYNGWQIQPNGITIQETLQTTLQQILQQPTFVTASGRTDAGVHAIGQVAHFSTEKEVSIPKLFASLNSLLPPDIRVLELLLVPNDFHSRYNAIAKTYHYHLSFRRDPFRRFHSVYYPYRLDLTLLKQAATLFVGTHDFTSFANEATKGSAAKDPVRTLKRLDIIEEEHGIRCEFEADGFLYKMVRNIMGTLLEVASSKRPIEDIPYLFKAKDRRLAGKAAPPHGLFLIKVDYEEAHQSLDNEKPLDLRNLKFPDKELT